MTKRPESVIPAQAGIQAIELNDKTTGCPPEFIPHSMRGGHDGVVTLYSRHQ